MFNRVRPLLLLVDATNEVKLDKLTMLNKNVAITKPYFVINSITNNSLSRSLMQKNI